MVRIKLKDFECEKRSTDSLRKEEKVVYLKTKGKV